MIALVQRVSRASVRIEGETVGSIGIGMLILLGIHNDDGNAELDWLTRKCASLRIFADAEGKMNKSIMDVSGDVMVVSQFTLYGNVERGNRPSFVDSARPEIAEPLYDQFVATMEQQIGRPVAAGRFGAMMDVELVNDGPVTIWLEKSP